jgi:serine/threonine protein kinase/Flp pilus assembly protein TadD
MPHPPLSRPTKSTTLPSPGDEVFHFRLGRELGRGAFARVFLAEQSDLGSRPVVVKCSTTEGSEPQTLAQLQHTNIVPIYSAHEDAEAGLRAVCMPYFGGASLAQVLRVLHSKNPRPLRGQDLVEALEEAQAVPDESGNSRTTAAEPPRQKTAREAPVPRGSGLRRSLEKGQSSGPTPLGLLRGLNYARAAAWIIARLADGLQHAHQRGVLHHDIKPSNILLGADGQPMLLDFNLSRRMHDEQAQATAVLGGTVTYMAPEHLRALTSKDPELRQKVDHRSDIYALGMVLFELLTGEGPFTQKGSYSALPVLIELMAMERTRTVPSARQARSDVPWSLESILRKCLVPNPAERYQQAAHLALDLRRFLEDQPLRYAPELSRVERVRKWFRRHPRLTSSVTVAAVAAALLAGVAWSLSGIRRNLEATQTQLEIARAQERKRAFEAGTQRALCLVNTTVEMQDHLGQGRKACREALNLYGILDAPYWQQRPEWARLDDEDRLRLGEDARELLLLLAWTVVRQSPGQAGLDRALELLDRAEGIEGLPPSRALWEDRAAYLARRGKDKEARTARGKASGIRAVSVRDRYLLATSYARSHRYAEAVAELGEALKQNPRHYWSSFQRGICYQEMRKFSLAAGDFGVCIGLWPEFALGYFNRGYSLDQGGDKEAAIADYSATLERDAKLAPAFVNRGMAYLELRRYAEALADFQKVVGLGRDDAFLHAGRGVALEGLRRFAEADTAFAAAFARALKAPEAIALRIRWVYGFAVCTRLPDDALAAFDAVLKRLPEHPQARYGRAMILAEKGKVAEAIAELSRAISASPGLVEARRCRAVLRARSGDLTPAREEIGACLAKAPDSGSVHYGAACVAAWEAQRAADSDKARQAQDRALAHLEKAFALGYGQDKAAEDQDLKGIKDAPGFRRLIQSQPAGKP